MIKRFLRALFPIFLIVVLALNAKERVYLPNPSKDAVKSKPLYTFNVGISASGSLTGYNTIIQGFTDALNDKGIIDNYSFNFDTISTEETGDAGISTRTLLFHGAELIFAVGKDALNGALISTYDTPVVMGDVVDYTGFVIKDSDGEVSRNFTGVSAMPNLEYTLSALIEGTPHIDGVALIYTTDDDDSIYQNELMEKLLDQAKIPWKEYEILPERTGSLQVELPEDDPRIIPSGKPFSASGKEGPLFDIDYIGDSGILNVINAPESARASRTSANWATNQKALLNPDPQDKPTDLNGVITLASSQCSSIFIPTKSAVSDYASTISEIALPMGVSTVGGDANIGKNTFVSVFTDPYDQGYRAGLLAYEVLVNGTPVSEIPLSFSTWQGCHKLFQDDLLGIYTTPDFTFPKSFREVDSFNVLFTTGSDTTRIKEKRN